MYDKLANPGPGRPGTGPALARHWPEAGGGNEGLSLSRA